MKFPFNRQTEINCIERKSKTNPQGLSLEELRKIAKDLGLWLL